MKKFNFKLQKLLELRKRAEEEARENLGRAIGVLNALEASLREVAEKEGSARGERFSRENSFTDTLAWELYLKRLGAERERLLKDAAQAEIRVEEERERYIEASRDYKAMDKLREKKFNEYRSALNKEEIRTINDLAGTVSAAKRG